MKGFQLLSTRPQNEQIDIQDIEQKFGFRLGPFYKLFLETFCLGENSIKREMFFNPKRNENYVLNSPTYVPLMHDENWFLSLSNLDSIEKIYVDWENFLKYEREWVEFGFLKIGDIGQGGGLFIGTKTDNQDQIFQVVWDNEEQYFKVCNNIFELIRGLEMLPLDNTIIDGFNTSEMYKSFGDENWHVKGS